MLLNKLHTQQRCYRIIVAIRRPAGYRRQGLRALHSLASACTACFRRNAPQQATYATKRLNAASLLSGALRPQSVRQGCERFIRLHPHANHIDYESLSRNLPTHPGRISLSFRPPSGRRGRSKLCRLVSGSVPPPIPPCFGLSLSACERMVSHPMGNNNDNNDNHDG